MSYIKAFALTLLLAVAAFAGQPWFNYNFQVVDTDGQPVTGGLNAYIYNTSDVSLTLSANSQGSTSQTNPVYFTTNGVLSFWSQETLINIVVVDTPTVQGRMKWTSIRSTRHRLVFPKIWRTVTPVEGVLNCVETLFDVATASTQSITGLAENNSISTATLIASGTTWVLADSFITDACITPRNITAQAYLVALTSASVTGSLVITGVNAQGESATETLSISTDAATGNVAFASVASFAFTATAITNFHENTVSLSIGTGVKIGLANNVNVSGDVYSVNEAGSKTTNYTLNTTYNTIDFASDPNATRDYTVIYKAKGRR